MGNSSKFVTPMKIILKTQDLKKHAYYSKIVTKAKLAGRLILSRKILSAKLKDNADENLSAELPKLQYFDDCAKRLSVLQNVLEKRFGSY
jgi:hypothetical protein